MLTAKDLGFGRNIVCGVRHRTVYANRGTRVQVYKCYTIFPA
jgi:hypothetical protein